MRSLLKYSPPLLAALLFAAACSGGSNGSYIDGLDGGPGSADGSSKGPGDAGEEEEETSPHALGTILLGEAHVSGESESMPIVSAGFVPDAKMAKACSEKIDGCELTRVAKCTVDKTSATGCGESDFCTWDEACKAICKPIAFCDIDCEKDEVCVADPKSKTGEGKCQKSPQFNAGTIAFSGTTTAITLHPPYSYESESDGSPFLADAEIRVQAQGATEAGFEGFDEKFKATTFLQTKPSLEKIPLSDVFGTGPLPVGWVAGEDSIVLTVIGAGGTASCKADDSKGSFGIPRSVIDSVRKSPDGKIADSTLTLSVARQRVETKKGKKTKGEIAGVTVQPVGWVDLVTRSSESTTFEGCASDLVACGSSCVDVTQSNKHCGDCNIACGASESCVAGVCTGGVCLPGAEDTVAACSDGCSNDGDIYIDCDDFDCCDARPDCPASSSCGQ